MLYPIAIEIGGSDDTHGVVFPDLPGCFSAGDTLEEAMANAKEAAHLHLEGLAEHGDMPPKPRALSDWQSDAEYEGWVWGVVEIDIEPYLGGATKKNVTLPRLLLKKIDDRVKENSKYKDRSHFLQIAAGHELER
ncbi:type II toxin-antitoxin system HicB family antitoxin [Photobacterium sp. WH24]|uniref:type II toxin-antitoxin system HicB family antitoxin n=1 Tax=Photobacterium sp. WH24 TaxID=2827237 RepID=UPI001C4652CC|nr:type II toxin-antitoxin system HicB family antitoxin [Photobacterium sp. WH24]MBV7264005.1 type II toxin-antitoxin system HicB family antitoxin [Photobacterium sp. WH24]